MSSKTRVIETATAPGRTTLADDGMAAVVSGATEEVTREDLIRALKTIRYKFQRAGGVLKVAHEGVQLGAMSWHFAVSDALGILDYCEDGGSDED